MKIGVCELELPSTQAGQSGKPRIPTHQPQAGPYEQIPAHCLPPLPNHQPRAIGSACQRARLRAVQAAAVHWQAGWPGRGGI